MQSINEKVCVIIPARNEIYLPHTIEDVLKKAEGDIEVIPILDGYDEPIKISTDPRVKPIHNQTAIGQRQSINVAAKRTDAKYILKTDGHSMFDQGFDVKLRADCEYDWTVIPRMFNLDVVNWTPKLNKMTDFMWFRSPTATDMPLRVQYWDAPIAREFPDEYKEHKANRGKDKICDVMTGQGACWFLHRDRFWDLGGMDEAHGHWGQMGVEVACKAWLSGGRQVVNKNTWFSHWFRKGDGPAGIPWPMSGKGQRAARKYSIELWGRNKWPQQVHDLQWLSDKFAPLPTWKHKTSIVVPDIPIDISVIMPARNEIYLQRTIDDLHAKLKTNYEIVVGLDNYTPDPPLVPHDRLVVVDCKERKGMRPLINILANKAKGRFLMRLDPHSIVDDGIDEKLISVWKKDYTVVSRRYELASKNWVRREKTDCDYRYLSHPSDPKGGLRGLAWPEYAAKHKHKNVDDVMTCSGSNWLIERERFLGWGGLDENHGTFGQEGVEIACMTWLSGGRFIVNKDTWYAHWNRKKSPYALGKKQKQISIDYSIDKWTNNKWKFQKYSFDWLIKKFEPVPGWPMKISEGIRSPKQGTNIKGLRDFSVDLLWDKRKEISDPSKRERLEIFFDSFSELIDDISADELKPCFDYKYWNYLAGHLNKKLRDPITEKGYQHIKQKTDSAIELFYDIKKNGPRSPLEFYTDNGDMILHKGYRRLVILKKLGYKNIPVRLFKSRREARLTSSLDIFREGVQPYRPPAGLKSIHELAADQFQKLQGDATDKYWVHDYTSLYDLHLGPLRRRTRKLLELGVAKGASLRLWRDVFPKAKIYGADKNETGWQKYTDGLDRVKVLIGNERDDGFIGQLKGLGELDIIIDDASHTPNLQLKMLNALWPSIASRGFYVIEDCYCSYTKNGMNLPMELTRLIDDIYQGDDVRSLSYYYNIIFIEKK
ncbi:MAG: glycosyltransferase [FCB group bacterium]|nr:glycosyltransferase [FCB group bacterium]